MNKKGSYDFSLYLVTDRALSRGRDLVQIVEAAVRGGVSCVQLREKSCSTRQYMDLAGSLCILLKKRGIPLIINDRLDVAMAVGADGVHLGQTDMPLSVARRILPETMIIGISAESLEDAIEAEKMGAHYVSASPIFSTPTKTDTAPPLGLEGLREIRRRIRIPLIGIGGLNRQNAAEAIRCGADGIAVVSAIVSADDPERAARALKTVIEQAKGS